MVWTWCRAVLHRGWWLVTSVYLVVDAGLSASELVLIGVAQGAVALVFEVPAGVVADTLSRKWSLLISHVLMGSAMIATGLVTGFGALVVTQMVWGLAWTFASGADVALITDELSDSARIHVVLLRSGRAQLTGAVTGMVGIGGLALLTSRTTAMVLAGTAMLLLGLYVLFALHETPCHKTPGHETHGRLSQRGWSVLVGGVALVRGNRELWMLFAATFLVDGITGSFGRLYPRRLVDIGLTADPVVWLGVLSLLTYLIGAIALRPRTRDVRRAYVAACAVGVVGVIGLVAAPEEVSGSAAVLVASSALPLTRTFRTILVNRQTTSEVRATVHSLLAQAEYLGAITCGLIIAALARSTNLALLTCAALLALAIPLVRRQHPG